MLTTNYYNLLNNLYVNYKSVLLISSKNNRLIHSLLKLSSLISTSLLVDLVGLDFFSKHRRFAIMSRSLSIDNSVELYTLISFSNNTYINSLAPIFLSAICLEREIWDLFGIFFDENPDLRRILTDYGFLGSPLRKDFPVVGFVSVFYNPLSKTVNTESLSLEQEPRIYKFGNPWILD